MQFASRNKPNVERDLRAGAVSPPGRVYKRNLSAEHATIV